MSEHATVRCGWDDLVAGCVRSLRARGASPAHAAAVADATATAEAEGNRAVGLAHLLDYLEALEAGRLVGDAEPVIEQPTPIVTRVDARGGTQHLGVERVFDSLVAAAREFGVAAVASRNGFTIGALSYFPRRLAGQGVAGLAFANAAPPVMPASGGRTPRFCTNPMAFAMPLPGGEAIVVDQSSTETALVAVKQAADRGEAIPEGWALDADGEPTTDPVAALTGMLLPFGGARVLASRICQQQIEKTYRAHVVRPLRVNGETIGREVQESVLVFFAMMVLICSAGLMAIALLEPALSLSGSLSTLFACLFNIGPGLAEVGPTQNFAAFGDVTLSVLALLMVLGRVELFAILVLFAPALWREF